MANKDLSRKCHKVRGRKDAWWSEEHAGIWVMCEPKRQTSQVLIPWRSIRTAMERKDRETTDG